MGGKRIVRQRSVLDFLVISQARFTKVEDVGDVVRARLFRCSCSASTDIAHLIA